MLSTVPVTHVAGVGQAKQQQLAELKIFSVHDLLHHFPIRYEDQRIRPFESFQDGARVCARAVVEGMATVHWKGRRSTCSVPLRIDGRVRITGMWFNQPYIKSKLVDGRPLVVIGRYDAGRKVLVVSQTEFDAGRAVNVTTEFAPVYRLVSGLSNAQMQRLILQALQQFADQVDELLPAELVTRYRLLSHRDALFAMHHPASQEDLHQAHRRLAFEEFFLFQLQLQWFRRRRDQSRQGEAKAVPDDALPTFSASLPFPLTSSQQAACEVIADDLRSGRPMTRLLQGDVGSGKTWVALWATYAAHRAGFQSTLMAPTEILAEQHAAEAERRLTSLGMRVALLTGRMSGKARRQLLSDIAAGNIHLVIGTHALLTEDVTFAKLGLVITDEQHRFGVQQRAVLRQKGTEADVLFLSATPIPRTLAMAVYGDLDVTTLTERPKGRQLVTTKHITMREQDKAIRFIRKELTAGRQAYVVAPLVEESEQLTDVLSATQLQTLMTEQFAGFSVALLHGRMSGRDKETVMRAFARGEIQVLVSTTVIEVGIDVPNASVMLVYHAERFGLAQLHQLRGRVGRGEHPGYCLLVSDATGGIALERLKTLVETSDGFVIAERDLELRGPGEFLGTRQSGLPEFTVGDLSKDFKVMQVARDEATACIADPRFWLAPAFAPARNWLLKTMDAPPVHDS
ncbi:MAG: ATP-dependent DNA helicase RecG [Alicyclobacillus sp.]|nr:ATP-dependent DNA helicase RecG [Alicyclobacillus sp.]